MPVSIVCMTIPLPISNDIHLSCLNFPLFNCFLLFPAISLSLEYHPTLLKGCSSSHIPPVRYLQCPACLKIRHLKRFLCSKFDIDPESKRIEVEVIYEDEVLPNDFTLMDVGYCYNWKRVSNKIIFLLLECVICLEIHIYISALVLLS